MRLVALVGIWISAAAIAQAHEVADDNHDRTITVRLTQGPTTEKMLIRIQYRLEVAEFTVVFNDLRNLPTELDFAKYKGKPDIEIYAEFVRRFEPVVAKNLRVRLNGQPLTLTCAQATAALRDEKGEKLGHLRCDFVFQTEAVVEPGKENLFEFREGNYVYEDGKIDVSAVVEGGWRIIGLTAPDDDLKKRAVKDFRPGDEDRLREVRIRFSSLAVPSKEPNPDALATPTPEPDAAGPKSDDHTGLRQLFLDYLLKGELSFWLVLALATIFGAMHALTPGHGKTLVAAYLVGQRGTVWHAVFLGIVTTLTHTGAVLILALVLGALPTTMQKNFQDKLQTGVGLALGLLIVCLGFWLLLQRLSGRADHVHLGGGHHHHGSDHHHHHHVSSPSEQVSWWGLVLLGITGGLIPCWDAIILLVATIAYGVFWLAFPLVVAFSAGLAGTLVLIGIMVVKFRAFAESHWGEGRLVRALPLLSALLVTAMGFWLCYESVQGK